MNRSYSTKQQRHEQLRILAARERSKRVKTVTILTCTKILKMEMIRNLIRHHLNLTVRWTMKILQQIRLQNTTTCQTPSRRRLLSYTWWKNATEKRWYAWIVCQKAW